MAAQDLAVALRLRYEDGGLRGRLEHVRKGLQALGRDGARAAQQLSSSLQRTEQAVVALDRRMRSAQRALLGLISAGTAFRLGDAIVQASLDMDRFQRALTVVSGSSEQAARDLAYVRDLSQRLGIDLRVATGEFAALAAAARGTSLQGQSVRDIFEAVSQAAVVLGLSADDVSGAFKAIQQIISKGTVSAEELRQQLGERLPGAFQIAARAMGVTTQELNRMLERGELLATDFLPRFAETLRAEFAEGVPAATRSAQAAFQRLRGALFELRAEIGRSGFVDALAQGVRSLTEALRDPTLQQSLATLARGIGEAIRAGIEAVVEFRRQLVVLGEFLIAGAVAKGLQALALYAKTTAAGFVAAAEAAGFFQRVVKRLAIVGLIVAALEFLQAKLLGVDEETQRLSFTERLRARSLEETIQQTRQYADTQVLAEDAVRRLTAAEARDYQERLDASRRYYRALAELKKGTDEGEAAERELERREAALARLKEILNERVRAEREFAERVEAIRAEELDKIKDSLAKELKAYEQANARLGELADQRKAVEQKFAEARAAIERGGEPEAPAGILDLASMLSQIRQADAAGMLDEMLSKAEQLRDAVVSALKEGLISRVDALFFLGQAERLARDAMDRMEQAAEQAAAKARATIERLVAKAEFLKRIEIGFDEKAAMQSTEALRERIQALLDRNPLRLKVDLEGPDGFRVKADQLVGDVEKRAMGGLITGPGTETSDSILARLSRGEYVVRAAAVRRYGLAFLEAINRMRLPRFAAGGLVPHVPALAPAAAGGAETSVTIVLDGQRYGPMRTSQETADGLREALLRTALKAGGRP